MNWNPFDLRGPDFLVFYAILSALLFAVVWLIHRWRESGREGDEAAWGRGVAKDPYQVACLRGGRNEVIQVAVVSLLERGLLAADGDNLRTTAENAADSARRPLDKAILTKFADSGKAQSLYTDEITLAEADAVGQTLKDKRLLPDEQTMLFRGLTATGAVAILWVIAGIKIAVALARGRHNIFFLLLMAGAAAVVAVLLTTRRRTALGNQTLAYLREVFGGLNSRKDSLRLNGRTGEVAFLAAAFGMAALPAALTVAFEPLNLRPPRPEPGSWGSCGSSCGSSCGGGGCGGGCGGCGD